VCVLSVWAPLPLKLLSCSVLFLFLSNGPICLSNSKTFVFCMSQRCRSKPSLCCFIIGLLVSLYHVLWNVNESQHMCRLQTLPGASISSGGGFFFKTSAGLCRDSMGGIPNMDNTNFRPKLPQSPITVLLNFLRLRSSSPVLAVNSQAIKTHTTQRFIYCKWQLPPTRNI
jgi:hypothetical protein